MPVVLKYPRGSNTKCFMYKRRKQQQVPGAIGDQIQYCKKLEYAAVNVNGITQKVEFQDTYTCQAGRFANIQPTPSKSYADRVHKKPSGKRVTCLRCNKVAGPRLCGPRSNCTTANFFQINDVKNSVELCETADMGIGVFATSRIPKNTHIGLYTGDLTNLTAGTGLTDLQVAYSAQPSWAITDTGGEKVNIDASERGNWTRFINHACAPLTNCAFSQRTVACGTQLVHSIRTTKDIDVGDQLFLDYGRAYFRQGRRIIRPGCLCGSRRCHSRPKN